MIKIANSTKTLLFTLLVLFSTTSAAQGNLVNLKTNKVTDISSTSATIILESEVSARTQIYYGTNPNWLVLKGRYNSRFSSGERRETLYNLQPGTTYYYNVSVRAQRRGAQAQKTDIKEFRTPGSGVTTTTLPPSTTTTMPVTTSTTTSTSTSTTVTTKPTACSVDRINSLLSSPSRVGFGRNTYGGRDAKSFTIVSNTNDSGPGSLRDAIHKRDSDPNRNNPVWVIFDESLDGETIFLDKGISTFQRNLTIDGRGSNGMLNITISPSSSANNIALLQLRGGNTILHGLTIDGQDRRAIGLMPRQGDNYWLDHLTITRFDGDDAISISQGGRSDSASEVTISNYRAYNTSKAVLLGTNPNYPNVRLNRVTIFNSELAARERNPRAGFNGQHHIFNSFVHSVQGGSGIDINYGTQMIAENNVISGLGAKAPQRLIAGHNNGAHQDSSSSPVGHVYTKGNILLHGADEHGSINPSNPPAYSVPYPYSLMPASQVESYVQQNAGAENASGSLLYCP